MKLIESKSLLTDSSSIEFTSIPQTYTSLLVLVSSRATTTNEVLQIRPNGSTANGAQKRLLASGAGVSHDGSTTLSLLLNGSGATASTFNTSEVWISNYATSAAVKAMFINSATIRNATTGSLVSGTHWWSNASAITSLTFIGTSGNLAAGTLISLYGISK
jgi:hypothetical protein